MRFPSYAETIGIVTLVMLPTPCSRAQPVDCFVNVSHDAFFGTVEPGEVVSVEVWLSWSPSLQFAGLRGDTIVTDDLGSIQGEIHTPYLNPGWPSTLPVLRGTPRGGSVINTDIAVIPSFFTASPNPVSIRFWHMTLIEFNWVAPEVATPTEVHFDFRTYPIAPNARFYLQSIHGPFWTEANTTFIGTSLVVLPAPASLGLLFAGAIAPRRRRRVRH